MTAVDPVAIVVAIAIVFCALALLGFRAADAHGPRVTLHRDPVDDARIHRAARPFSQPATKGFTAGFLRDDRAVEEARRRYELDRVARLGDRRANG